MRNPNPRFNPGQAGLPIDVRPDVPQAAPPKGKNPWALDVPMAFLDARTTSLSDQAKIMLMILCAYAREAPFCSPSNDELRARTGKSLRAVQEILEELGVRGYIRRVRESSTDEGGSRRTIYLRWRSQAPCQAEGGEL